jgi:hypothetical protein
MTLLAPKGSWLRSLLGADSVCVCVSCRWAHSVMIRQHLGWNTSDAHSVFGGNFFEN